MQVRRHLDYATSPGEAASKRMSLLSMLLAKGVASRMSVEITHADLSPYWYLTLVTDFPELPPGSELPRVAGEMSGGDA